MVCGSLPLPCLDLRASGRVVVWQWYYTVLCHMEALLRHRSIEDCLGCDRACVLRKQSGRGSRWPEATDTGQFKPRPRGRLRLWAVRQAMAFHELLELGQDLGVVLAHVAQHPRVVRELAQVAHDEDQPELPAERLQFLLQTRDFLGRQDLRLLAPLAVCSGARRRRRRRRCWRRTLARQSPPGAAAAPRAARAGPCRWPSCRAATAPLRGRCRRARSPPCRASWNGSSAGRCPARLSSARRVGAPP